MPFLRSPDKIIMRNIKLIPQRFKPFNYAINIGFRFQTLLFRSPEYFLRILISSR